MCLPPTELRDTPSRLISNDPGVCAASPLGGGLSKVELGPASRSLRITKQDAVQYGGCLRFHHATTAYWGVWRFLGPGSLTCTYSDSTVAESRLRRIRIFTVVRRVQQGKLDWSGLKPIVLLIEEEIIIVGSFSSARIMCQNGLKVGYNVCPGLRSQEIYRRVAYL